MTENKTDIGRRKNLSSFRFVEENLCNSRMPSRIALGVINLISFNRAWRYDFLCPHVTTSLTFSFPQFINSHDNSLQPTHSVSLLLQLRRPHTHGTLRHPLRQPITAQENRFHRFGTSPSNLTLSFTYSQLQR